MRRPCAAARATVSETNIAVAGRNVDVQPPPPPDRGTSVSLQRLWPVTAHRCFCCSSKACTSATSQHRESAGATLRIRWRKLHRMRAASEPVRRRLLARPARPLAEPDDRRVELVGGQIAARGAVDMGDGAGGGAGERVNRSRGAHRGML